MKTLISIAETGEFKKAKYVKREFLGQPGRKYRYYYNVPGRGIVSEDALKAGTRFRAHADNEHHYHVHKVEGDHVHVHKVDEKGKRIKHDDGSDSKKMHVDDLKKHLHDIHGDKIKEKREKIKGRLKASKEAKAKGHTKSDAYIKRHAKKLAEHDKVFGKPKSKIKVTLHGGESKEIASHDYGSVHVHEGHGSKGGKHVVTHKDSGLAVGTFDEAHHAHAYADKVKGLDWSRGKKNSFKPETIKAATDAKAEARNAPKPKAKQTATIERGAVVDRKRKRVAKVKDGRVKRESGTQNTEFTFMESASPKSRGRALKALETEVKDADGNIISTYEWVEGLDKKMKADTIKMVSSRAETGYVTKTFIGPYRAHTKAEVDYFNYLKTGGKPYSTYLAETKKEKDEQDRQLKSKKRREHQERKDFQEKRKKDALTTPEDEFVKKHTDVYDYRIKELSKKRQTDVVKEDIESQKKLRSQWEHSSREYHRRVLEQATPGTRHERKDGTYEKQADGTWERVTGGRKAKRRDTKSRPVGRGKKLRLKKQGATGHPNHFGLREMFESLEREHRGDWKEQHLSLVATKKELGRFRVGEGRGSKNAILDENGKVLLVAKNQKLAKEALVLLHHWPKGEDTWPIENHAQNRQGGPFERDDYPGYNIKLPQIPAPKKPVIKPAKTTQDIHTALSEIASTDEMRRERLGVVHYNKDDQEMVATDGHKLVVIPAEVKESGNRYTPGVLKDRLKEFKKLMKAGGLKDEYKKFADEAGKLKNIKNASPDMLGFLENKFGTKPHEDFVDYNAVIPKHEAGYENQDILTLLEKSNYALDLSKHVPGGAYYTGRLDSGMVTSINGPDGIHANLNPQNVSAVLRSLAASGAKKVTIGIGSPVQGVTFHADNGAVGLVMPVRYNDWGQPDQQDAKSDLVNNDFRMHLVGADAKPTKLVKTNDKTERPF